ncbi:MAG TPA: DUF424 family protein [Methanomicrobia archaeon]|nr:DUF424 family protein [Methanomicrobia archaeon]
MRSLWSQTPNKAVNMEVFIKIYKTGGDLLIAVCDKDLLGKRFMFNDIMFEVKESFYGGEKKDIEEIRSILEKATILNLVGNETVKKCIEWGFIKKENVIKIGETVHAQMVKV